MTAAGLFVLLGFIALAIDMGIMYTARADCQKIADAAALAGAKEAFFYTPADPVATARTAAISAARANYVPRNSNDNRLQNANIVVNTTERTVQVTLREPQLTRIPWRPSSDESSGSIRLTFPPWQLLKLPAYSGRTSLRCKMHQALVAARPI